jgi:hypothetical protein
LNDRGIRNIFLKAGNNTVRQLTTYADDDGQELTELTFTGDGKHILFVRGGAPNTRGESPNPASLVVAPDRALWMISVTGGAPVKILKGSGFVLHKDSKTGNESVIFSNGGQIHKAQLKPDASAVQMFFARGGNYNPAISPDGSEVLFVSDRGDHSFIGIFNIGLNKVRWIQPDANRDMMPVWSPDGKQVAFIRLPGQRAGELPLQVSNLRQYSVPPAKMGFITSATLRLRSAGIHQVGSFSFRNTPESYISGL